MIRERDIEKKACDLAKAAGWLVFKFVSPSQRGVPDRIFIRQGRIVFIEFKADQTAKPNDRTALCAGLHCLCLRFSRKRL